MRYSTHELSFNTRVGWQTLSIKILIADPNLHVPNLRLRTRLSQGVLSGGNYDNARNVETRRVEHDFEIGVRVTIMQCFDKSNQHVLFHSFFRSLILRVCGVHFINSPMSIDDRHLTGFQK